MFIFGCMRDHDRDRDRDRNHHATTFYIYQRPTNYDKFYQNLMLSCKRNYNLVRREWFNGHDSSTIQSNQG